MSGTKHIKQGALDVAKKKKKKVKGKTFRDPQGEAVMVMGHSGKCRMEFRPW